VNLTSFQYNFAGDFGRLREGHDEIWGKNKNAKDDVDMKKVKSKFLSTPHFAGPRSSQLEALSAAVHSDYGII
jgi:hypothetical protein